MAPDSVATLTHLNDDTSWLLTLPGDLPDSKFTIAIDPWLSGSQTDYFPLFSRQTHVAAPAFSSLPELTASVGKIDAIVCSHEFTDHCHEETLRTASSDTLVWAHPRAKQRIEGWKMFQRPVGATPIAGKSWPWASPTQPRIENEDQAPKLPGNTLRQMGQEAGWDALTLAACPDHISLLYIPTDDRFDPAGDRLHGLTIISFFKPENPTRTYSIVYSPHGIPPLLSHPSSQPSPVYHTPVLGADTPLRPTNDAPSWGSQHRPKAVRVAVGASTEASQMDSDTRRGEEGRGLGGTDFEEGEGSKAGVEALLKEAGLEGVEVVVLKSGDSEEL